MEKSIVKTDISLQEITSLYLFAIILNKYILKKLQQAIRGPSVQTPQLIFTENKQMKHLTI